MEENYAGGIVRTLSLFVLFSIVVLIPGTALGVGGPDGFGYYWESTQDYGDSIRFEWVDPAGHTELVGWYPNADDGRLTVQLPFSFPFYGETLDSIVICTNGFLQSPTKFTYHVNSSLPDERFSSLIAMFWDDLTPGGEGRVTMHSSLDYVCVTWDSVKRYGTSQLVCVQLLLYPDGTIRVNCKEAPAVASSATVGIQANGGHLDNYLQYVFDGDPAGHAFDDSTSLRFFTRDLAHDVAVSRIDEPDPWIPANGQVVISAVIRNYGEGIETFPVTTASSATARRAIPSSCAPSTSRPCTRAIPTRSTSSTGSPRPTPIRGTSSSRPSCPATTTRATIRAASSPAACRSGSARGWEPGITRCSATAST